MNYSDVLIIGAGPAGSAAALYAKQNGLSVTLVEKSTFPREKICGDGLSTFSINRIKELGLWDDFLQLPHSKIEYMTFGAPNGTSVTIPTSPKGINPPINGYTCSRIHFDNLLFENARRISDRFIMGVATGLIHKGNIITGTEVLGADGEKLKLTARTIIAADGYPSFSTRHSGLETRQNDDLMLSVRAYYENVPFRRNTIEMHFPKSILPGYVWIFPVDASRANVGICLPKQVFKNIRTPLRTLFEEVLLTSFKNNRLAHARRATPIKGGTLPLGNISRPMGFPGLLRCGDAAGLIDPFTGEGIGNAMTSSKLAIEAITEHQTPEDILAAYTTKIAAKFSAPFSIAHKLHNMARHPFFMNFLSRRARSSEFVREWMSEVLSDSVNRDVLTSPVTYLKLLAGKHGVS